jgi:uncharacterized protein (DUF849 family)
MRKAATNGLAARNANPNIAYNSDEITADISACADAGESTIHFQMIKFCSAVDMPSGHCRVGLEEYQYSNEGHPP